jgi:hypothetical protein
LGPRGGCPPAGSGAGKRRPGPSPGRLLAEGTAAQMYALSQGTRVWWADLPEGVREHYRKLARARLSGASVPRRGSASYRRDGEGED